MIRLDQTERIGLVSIKSGHAAIVGICHWPLSIGKQWPSSLVASAGRAGIAELPRGIDEEGRSQSLNSRSLAEVNSKQEVREILCRSFKR